LPEILTRYQSAARALQLVSPVPLALRGLEIDRRGLALLAAFQLIANPLAFDQMAEPRTLD
jgi:hypothetical protein